MSSLSFSTASALPAVPRSKETECHAWSTQLPSQPVLVTPQLPPFSFLPYCLHPSTCWSLPGRPINHPPHLCPWVSALSHHTAILYHKVLISPSRAHKRTSALPSPAISLLQCVFLVVSQPWVSHSLRRGFPQDQKVCSVQSQACFLSIFRKLPHVFK